VNVIFINKHREAKIPIRLGKSRAKKYLKEISVFKIHKCFKQTMLEGKDSPVCRKSLNE